MNIVIHAFPAWEGNYLKSTVQLATELARTHRVLYVDYAYTWKDFINSIRGRGFAHWRRMIGLEKRLREVELDNGARLHVLTLPPVLPANFLKNLRFYDALNRLNAAVIMPTIRRTMAQLGMTGNDAPTVINAFNPTFGVHTAGRLGERRLIYYCYDEISAATWAKTHGARLEQQFMEQVDAVVVSSQGLFDKKSALHPHCYLVKNGVDFALFNQKIDPSVSKPKSPIIGYLGSVDERLDYDLLEKLARETPQYRYVFVGRVPSDGVRARLSALQNVQLVGAQPPATLPNWVQSFDVCLIPFLKNELTAGIYPLKANEYLAAGKPVVATPFANLTDFDGVISVADGAVAFQKAVENSFLPNEKAIEKRINFAAKNAWSARAEEMVDILNEY